MKILSWNIQSGLGCDSIRDLERIALYIRHHDPDIICLQEVSRYIKEYTIPGFEDQYDFFSTFFSDYTPCWGAGGKWLNDSGQFEEFGNLTLLKRTAKTLLHRSHLLPRPPAHGKKQLQRVAVETVLSLGNLCFRLVNTHLAFHVLEERQKQLEYFCRFQQWVEESAAEGVMKGSGAYSHHADTVNTILCGDFNFTPESEEYRFFTDSGWLDCWKIVGEDTPHPPTCGIYDHHIWPQGKHCRDFFWLQAADAIIVANILVDQEINYSDHQPITLILQEV